MEIYENGIPTFHEAREALSPREDMPGLSGLTLNEDGKTFAITPGVEEWRSLSKEEKLFYKGVENVTVGVIGMIISILLLLSSLLVRSYPNVVGFLTSNGVIIFLVSIIFLAFISTESKDEFKIYSETSNRDSNRTKNFLEFDEDCRKIVLESLKLEEGTGALDYLERAYNEKVVLYIAEREKAFKEKQKIAQEREAALDNRQYEAVKRMLDLSTVNATAKNE